MAQKPDLCLLPLCTRTTVVFPHHFASVPTSVSARNDLTSNSILPIFQSAFQKLTIKPFLIFHLFSSKERIPYTKVHVPFVWYLLHWIVLYDTISIMYFHILSSIPDCTNHISCILVTTDHRTLPDHCWGPSSAFKENKLIMLAYAKHFRLLYVRNTKMHKTIHYNQI